MKMTNKKYSLWFFGFVLIFTSAPSVAEDLLEDDGFSFEEETDVTEDNWRSAFKVTLDQSQTHIAGGLQTQRSTVRMEFEDGFTKGWYIKLDSKYRYFWHKDQLAQQQKDAYGHHQWQQAWLQYSFGACAIKSGRQTLIWGEVEGTFAVDIVTPFDYTEQLLTEYSNIRLAQDMAFAECFSDRIQTQLFYIPNAKTDVYRHNTSQYPVQLAPGTPALDMGVDAEEEWGGRLKWLGDGFDISIMVAKLYGNSPVVVFEQSLPKADISYFTFYGLSSSVARGRLLMKFDAGYKTDQLTSMTSEASDRYDVAIGLEYTTSSNHNINGGFWRAGYKGDDAPNETDIITFGWSKTYLKDDLSMSLLGNWISEPRFKSITLRSEYQWDDYWNISAALGLADSNDSTKNTPVYRPDESLVLAIKYEF